jgi:hypothetical protein
MAEITFTTDKEQCLTYVTVVGRVLPGELKEIVNKYANEQYADKVLWNLMEADASALTGEEIRAVHYHALDLFKSVSSRKVAVVADRPLEFGLGRMSDSYGELTNPSNYYRTFYSVEESLEWLSADQATDK